MLGALVGIALLLPLVVGSPASADQIADKKAEAARLAAQLDIDGNKVSMAAEHYNQAQLKVQDVRASLDKAKGELARADSRMQAARGLMAQAAVQAYVSGGSANLFSHLAHANNDDLVLRQQYLRFTAADQSDVIGQVRAAKEDFRAVQGRLSDEERAAAAAAAQAETAKQQAADAEAASRAVLAKANGDLADMVAAESARRQAAQLTAAPVIATPQGQAAPLATPIQAQPAQAQAAKSQPATKAAPAVVAAPPSSGGAGAAVAEAERQVGKPYVYGAAGPDSFDCSGLTMWAWRAGGVSLSHSAQAQYNETTRVPLNALQPGDLLFFGSSTSNIGHNAIYIGNGQMVEAPHTGLNVRYAGAFRSDLVGAGRPG
ncbi:MAG: NlpC/P60 family protein [Acidimicrobiales bacterium]